MVEWAEKASFNRLNRLFEIAAGERNYQTLLSARNLQAVVRESQSYTLNILPRRLPKSVVSGEHFIIKDLSFYTEAHELNAQAPQECLSQREEKRQEGALRRAPGEKCHASFPPARLPVEKKKKTPMKGIVIRSPAPPSSFVSTSESNLPRCVPGANGSGPFVLALALLTPPIEEESAVDQPGSFHSESEDLLLLVVDKPTVEEPGPSCLDSVPSGLIVIEEPVAERPGSSCREPESLVIVVLDELAMKRPTPSCDLQASFGERLQI